MIKNLLFLTLSILFLASCNDKPKVEKSYYDDGSLHIETHYNKDGIMHGMFTSYYENGKPEKTINYTNGVPDGMFTHYLYIGFKKEETNYENGKKEGKSILYDDFEGVLVEQNYTNDLLNGPYTEYYEASSTIKVMGNYKDGKEDGSWSCWDRNGNKTEEVFFENGNGTKISYHEDGTISIETPYVNFQKNGVEKHYSPTGKLIGEIVYKNDVEISKKEIK